MKTPEDRRVTLLNAHAHGIPAFLSSVPGDTKGAFVLVRDGVPLQCIATRSMGWDHVSVVVQDRRRCPTWEEMDYVKRTFWEDTEAVMQLHPPRSEHVNFHPYCLHLWRPQDTAILLPPKEAVL